MSILDKLSAGIQRTAKRVVTLPVVSDRVLEDPKLERNLALAGVVPKRCGLCKSFVAQDMADTLRMNPAFAQAMTLLAPSIMGQLKAKPGDPAPPRTPIGSEAARELRPNLSNRWDDYGGCANFQGLGVWAFAEEPKIPGEMRDGGLPKDAATPCKEWR